MHETLRPKVREAEGREFTPSVAIIDSQSVKTTVKHTRGSLTLSEELLPLAVPEVYGGYYGGSSGYLPIQ
jgi:hypothetical protein